MSAPLDLYWDEDESLECHNHCDWRGTYADLDNPSEDQYCCPKCGVSSDMILPVETKVA